MNAFEAYGIADATAWASGNKRFLRTLLTDEGLRNLHKRMFRHTWKWAGVYRRTQRSIGVDASRIAMEVRNLLADVEAWLEFGSYARAEIAARFHHRLVQIHPFPNGNGRHARLATDLLCERQGWPKSDWGASDLVKKGEARAVYIEALRRADELDFGLLLDFMNLPLDRKTIRSAIPHAAPTFHHGTSRSSRITNHRSRVMSTR